MEFIYRRKIVNTNEEFINALKEGCVDVIFPPEQIRDYDAWDRRIREWATFLRMHQNESPMIAWRYAKMLRREWEDRYAVDEYEDTEGAYKIMASLAEQDFAPAMHSVFHWETDEEKAKCWMERAVQLGYGPALFDVGFDKYCHAQSDADREEGLSLMKRAQQAGVPRVVNCIAKHYAELEDARMIDYCRIGLDECNDICAYLLAECYKEGKFVEKDYCYAAELYKKCVEWYHYPKYADLDSGAYPLGDAYWALGELHENNLLPGATVEKAFYYYKLGADSGERCYKIAEMYEYGIGTEPNYEEAAVYYREAVGSTARTRDNVDGVRSALIRLRERFEKKLADTLRYLGDVYRYYDKDYAKAEECYERAFELGATEVGYDLQEIDRLQGRAPRDISQNRTPSNVTPFDDVPF